MTTSKESLHPSYLALDRAALTRPGPELESHLQSCEQCRAYLEALAATPSVRDRAALQLRLERSHRTRSRWWWGAPPLAVAAGALLFAGLRPQPSLPTNPSYVGVKGFPSVWIYVKHGSTTALWNGKAALFVGDQLRLKIDPGQYRRLEVYSVKRPQAPELLYSGNIAPARTMTLPDAWEVDAEPGDERLLVVLSNEPVKPAVAEWLGGKVPASMSVQSFVLPKSLAPDPNPDSGAP